MPTTQLNNIFEGPRRYSHPWLGWQSPVDMAINLDWVTSPSCWLDEKNQSLPAPPWSCRPEIQSVATLAEVTFSQDTSISLAPRGATTVRRRVQWEGLKSSHAPYCWCGFMWRFGFAGVSYTFVVVCGRWCLATCAWLWLVYNCPTFAQPTWSSLRLISRRRMTIDVKRLVVEPEEKQWGLVKSNCLLYGLNCWQTLWKGQHDH